MKTTPSGGQSAQNHAYDVIISGAGPVGLWLACELALAGCSVLILEKAESPDSPLKRMPFGMRGLNAPTVDALYRRGLLNEFKIHQHLKNPHSVSAPAPRRQAGHFAGIPFYFDDVDAAQWKYRLPGTINNHLLSEMEEVESVLTRRAETLGVSILRGLGVTDFRQTATGVTVEAGDRSFTGKWLAGCDGARSVIRKKGAFDFAGTEPEFTGYSLLVDIADPGKLKPGRNKMATGMYLQSQPGYLIMQDFDGGAFRNADKPVTLEHVQQLLRRISETDVTVTALHLATTWTDRTRQATSYRNGRVFLAGDAAHIHSPLGGQGLNLGLGDAMNLGWKLAAVINGKAPEDLLDTYTAERHPVGVQVLDWSRAQVAIMKPDAASNALYNIIADLMHTRNGATYMAERVWGVNMHYPPGNHPMTGYSVPDFELEDGTKLGAFMQEGHGILLDFEGNATLKTWAAAYSNSIRYIARSAKEQLGVSALLVRPDGIVAWAADQVADDNNLREVAARWFVPDQDQVTALIRTV
ncbi:FAD-dependent monooxygenase [Chitinophaga solisilvae]|uniref:FAD-dependent monooxygenase n=1 Tax=Chitinophaga solisilvae TaxID=1233460 RepID=UPI00136AE376|nr:FAD-dependent monooxygenase [Chitinophaga solisilvae]